MKSFQFESFLSRSDLEPWQEQFCQILDEFVFSKKHGHALQWLELVSSLPEINILPMDNGCLNHDTINIGKPSLMTERQSSVLKEKLLQLKPWRKGPYNFFGIHIDTEWRSDWKWNRISPHLSPLKNRKVLDVGCGSGYHGWRMLGEGAIYVLGIDPTMRFYMQHLCCQHYLHSDDFDFLPIGIEHLPEKMEFFDTTFSMGVLYHRREMQQHLIELRNTLRNGGELVLETLIVDQNYPNLMDGVLVPEDRYAMMRNVWNIPTIEKLTSELQQSGFTDIRCIEANVTSLEEQRRTEWIDGYSLKEFLDPMDVKKTVEGYPAPKRATLIAKKNQ